MAGFTTRHEAGSGQQGEGHEWPLGDRDSRWPLFAQGAGGDRARPSAWQVMILHDLSGPDGRCAGATDDEVMGVLGQWNAAASWIEGRGLAVMRELIRRRPDDRTPGAATESGLPWDWDDRLAHEIALELRVSVPAARKLAWAAWALEARLPNVGNALDEGRLDLGRAKMVIQETDVLQDLAMLAAAERLIIDGLPRCKTWLELQRLVQRAVVAVDPDGARKRREQEEKEHARVRFWREAAGTCALMGAGLPTDEALKAHAHVDQRAQQYRAAGIKRPIDILRVAAYLDLLNLVPPADRIARFQAEDAAADHAAAEASGASDANRNGSSDGDRRPGDAPGGGVTLDPTGSPCGPSGDSNPEPAVAAEVNLTLRHLDIPFITAAGYGQRAGEARSLGVLDPALARRLAEAAARHPGSKFCLTIVDSDGQAIGHGCCKPRKPPDSPKASRPQQAGKSCETGQLQQASKLRKPPDSPKASGSRRPPGGRHSGRSSGKGRRDGPPPPAPVTFTLTRGNVPGPPRGFGSWILTLPGQAQELAVDLHAVPTGECDHSHESQRHDPGVLLRHLVSVRDGKCGFPACSRHATESDLEHARPFEDGGRTCGCNCWSCSRSCHQVKQSEGWTVTEARPGYHQWTTPSGRHYTQEPWRYPA